MFIETTLACNVCALVLVVLLVLVVVLYLDIGPADGRATSSEPRSAHAQLYPYEWQQQQHKSLTNSLADAKIPLAAAVKQVGKLLSLQRIAHHLAS